MKRQIVTCDRCGQEVKGTVGPPGTQSVYIKDKEGETPDLCPNCERQFERFMKNEDVGAGNSTFRGIELPCPHHIPCAAPCQGQAFERVQYQ